MTPWRRVLSATPAPGGKVAVKLECGHLDSFDPCLPFAVIREPLLKSTRPCKSCLRGE